MSPNDIARELHDRIFGKPEPVLRRPAHKGFPAPDPKAMVPIGRVMSTGPRGVTFYKTRALRVGATLYALQEDAPELN